MGWGYFPNMILITGASGKTGQAIVKACAESGKKVRAWVHHPDQIEPIRAIGADEVITGDLLDAEVLNEACSGIETIYLICPNMSPHEVEFGKKAIHAARMNGVGLFVYHSVFHPQISLMPHHWNKCQVEEAIFQSGLNHAILQPTVYLQNLLSYWTRIVNEGVYSVPYSAQTRLSFVDLDNIASAALRIFTDQKLWGGTYELVGTYPLAQDELTREIEHKIGRPVRFEELPHSEWERTVRRQGMSEYSIQTLLKMFEYYDHYGMWGSPHVLTGLLGRTPTSLEEFISRISSR
jgi:NAD(P)H dehydrogenase (quinone)